jgi:hypothetical protein
MGRIQRGEGGAAFSGCLNVTDKGFAPPTLVGGEDMGWKRLSLACAAGFAVGSAADAHHSPAGYDRATETILTGTIAELSWRNPHIYFILEMTNPDGSTSRQEIQAGSISVATTLGITRDLLEPGKRVSVRVHPSRRGDGRIAWGVNMTDEDGVAYSLDIGGDIDATDRSVEAESIAGSWVPTFGALRQTGLSLQDLPMTDAARAAREDFDSWRRLEASCTQWPPPRLMTFTVQRTITVADDRVTLDFDWMGAKRVVHLDQTEHPADLEPTIQGHSIGRWEGDTLVIDTVGFEPNLSGVNLGVPAGLGKHMVERVSLTEDKRHLLYEFTIEDPEYLLEPVSASSVWDHRPDIEPSGVQCDDDVADRFLELE